MGSFLDKHSNHLNNKIKQKIICIPFVLTSGDELALSSWFYSRFVFFFFSSPF